MGGSKGNRDAYHGDLLDVGDVPEVVPAKTEPKWAPVRTRHHTTETT